VLSGLSVGDLQQAVSAQDSARLVKIPGIGKKTAERLLLELRDKLPSAAAILPAGRDGTAAAGADVLNALSALGYSDKEAAWAIKQVEPSLPVAEAIRQCLRLLSKA
jgi:Holliday junction DNA helicase RuvA